MINMDIIIVIRKVAEFILNDDFTLTGKLRVLGVVGQGTEK